MFYCQEALSEAEIIRNSFTFLLQNDSQAISFSEFRETMMSTGNPLTDSEVRRFFALCDDESDGILRIDEFLKVIRVRACKWLNFKLDLISSASAIVL